MGIVLNEHCELVLAADGVEAIETLRSRSVDVVLLDLIMPRMNGRETLAHLRREHARTPVIVLTAVADVPTVVAAIKEGAYDYLTKPWDDDVLIALVHRAARDERGDTGVLLVSDSISSLAPLQLALEPQTRVITTSMAYLPRCPFLPKAIVVDCAPSRSTHAEILSQTRGIGPEFHVMTPAPITRSSTPYFSQRNARASSLWRVLGTARANLGPIRENL